MHQLPRIASFALAVALCGIVFLRSSAAADPDDTTALVAALDELDQWLGDGENGDRWREYLQSAELRAQTAKGREADPAVVTRALQQYRSAAEGLGKRRFVAARRAIESWRDALQKQYLDDLVKSAWAARGDHMPVSDEKLEMARTTLRSVARQLESRLGGTSSFAQGWKAWLKWPLLEPHFSNDFKITGQSLRDLDGVQRRLQTNKPGLEHPVFVRTAQALDRYRELAYWNALSQRLDTRQRYTGFLSELEKQLTRNLEKPTVETTRQIGTVLDVMHHVGDSPQVAQRIKAEFGRPNLMASVSTSAAQQIAQRPVSETSPVRDVILGAQVRGTANTTGVLSLKSLPADDHVALELQIAGNIQSRTFSYKKPVRVGSLGSTNYVATKLVQLSDERFRLLPAAASARTSTRIRSVRKTGGNFGRRLIEKIARKKVYESKRQAEYIAARHAERQLEDKFDRQVVEGLLKARQNYDQKLMMPLRRIGMTPDHVHMASSESRINLATTLASYKQISTNTDPPKSRVSNDLTIQLHETAANNMLPHLFGGAKIQQDEESEPPRVTGDVPDWLKKLGDEPRVKEQFVQQEDSEESQPLPGPQAPAFKPWSFLLNTEHPVSVRFDDQKLTVRIRIAELTTIEDGEESIRRNWDFLVTYFVLHEDNRIVLRRHRDVEALPTGFDPEWFGDERWDDKLTGKQAGIRRNLEENINKRAAKGGGFPLEIEIPPLEIPGPNDTKRPLRLQQFDCDDGWLTVGYRLR